MPPDRADDADQPTVQSHVRARFRVELPSGTDCALLESGVGGNEVTQDIVQPDGEEACRVEVTTADGSRRLLGDEVDDGCVCPAFRRHDCVASIESFDDDALIVAVATDDREELSTVVASLRDLGATVQLERIGQSNAAPERRLLELEADDVTEKQLEAVRTAVESGYYERPRQADLGDLATELGVSRSAVSQRLAAVESKLITELFAAENGESEAT